MKFKDFLKDKLLYIFIYFISTFLAITIMMLDLIIREEKLKISNIIYAFVLSSVFLVIFLYIDYMKKRKFYNLINSKRNNDSYLLIFL